MITSTSNSQVKQAAALAKKARERRQTGLFLVEGRKMYEEAPKSWLEKVYVTEEYAREYGEPEGVSWEFVSAEVMRAMADTQTPQGILALVHQPRWTLADVWNGGKPHIIMLETLQDPGNLGTILRAGEGAGITGVIMNRETADIFNPKVIRSTMGSVYRVPFVYTDSLALAAGEAKSKGIRLFAAHLKGENSYDREDYREGCGFLIGNEARGLTDEAAALADCYVKIPMLGKVESLNAAVAASVLMFEAARQRRAGNGPV
ncbi:MAG TPA: RNA methyltransferase [Candidatus Lachnoclostridium stercorigallinarum]|uniref:RNA methyltransferase n=1 Tax=Candidatus Lachnoclostridium stercorigallinarum TaxID=2838634 RepID=A0A9D2GGP1_9FIRM|nr:RNA methyltransferase [Candidatus Lachnoclostridium stercorigallinarum]